MFTLTSLKGHGLWFVIGGFRSIWFIYCVAWLVIVVCGALVGFLIFLNLVTCENKAMSAFLRQKFHSPSRFPSPFSVLFLRACSNIGICINPAPTQMIDGIGKPKIPSKFAKRAACYNEFGSKAPISTNSADWSLFPKSIFPLVSILWILTTLSFDYVLLLLGENWCWSLLGPKGFKGQLVVTCVRACLHGGGGPLDPVV